MKKNKSIIGETYIPLDNSYCLNLSMGPKYLLAGSYNQNPKETIIVSDPYVFEVNSVLGVKNAVVFIDVEYNGDIVRVMYFERGVGANLEERIKAADNLKELLGGY